MGQLSGPCFYLAPTQRTTRSPFRSSGMEGRPIGRPHQNRSVGRRILQGPEAFIAVGRYFSAIARHSGLVSRYHCASARRRSKISRYYGAVSRYQSVVSFNKGMVGRCLTVVSRYRCQAWRYLGQKAAISGINLVKYRLFASIYGHKPQNKRRNQICQPHQRMPWRS